MMKIGVIGAGRWGKNHVHTLADLPCILHGVADVDPAAATIAAQFRAKYYPAYAEMLPHVDAVTVAVPTDLHYQVVKNCLLAGKHVLVEKPVTLQSTQTNELVELAEKKKIILSVGYLYRFNATVVKLKDLLAQAGRLQYITARYIHSTNPPRTDSGAVVNLGVHLIDILNFILEQRPARVYCKKMDLLANGLEESALITLDYEDFYATLEVSSCHPLKSRDMWIIAEKHKIYADFLNQEIKVFPIEVSYRGVKKGEPWNVPVMKAEPLAEELRHFIICVANHRNGEYAGIINIGREEYYTSRICELALLSAAVQRDLDVPTARRSGMPAVNVNQRLNRWEGERLYA